MSEVFDDSHPHGRQDAQVLRLPAMASAMNYSGAVVLGLLFGLNSLSNFMDGSFMLGGLSAIVAIGCVVMLWRLARTELRTEGVTFHTRGVFGSKSGRLTDYIGYNFDPLLQSWVLVKKTNLKKIRFSGFSPKGNRGEDIKIKHWLDAHLPEIWLSSLDTIESGSAISKKESLERLEEACSYKEDFLSTKQNRNVACAARACQRNRTQEALPYLHRLLVALPPSPLAMQPVIWALREIGQSESAPPLLEALNRDDTHSVYEQLAGAFCQLATAKDAAKVRSFLETDSGYLKGCAHAALKRIAQTQELRDAK